MCMYTSLVERTPAAGRHANFSAGVASASAVNCRETCLHSPSYPCQIPSGGAWANKTGVLNKSHSKNAFRRHVFTSSSSNQYWPWSSRHDAQSQHEVYSMAGEQIDPVVDEKSRFHQQPVVR